MNETKKTPTGTVIDELLNGGFENDVVTTIYGPSGAGKTNICVVAATAVAKSGGKVIFIDTEGGFSADRARQICGDETEKVLGKIFFFHPTDFKEQLDVFEQIKNLAFDEIKLVVIDTISMHYRIERGETDDVTEANNALARQIAYLTQIARKHGIPILISNQVYADFENPNGVKLVGGEMMKSWSKCLIELQAGHNGVRKATLIKHRSLPQSKEILFKIINEGIVSVE